ncbi:MAG: alpha/beta hydrolase, partial [Planctomycetales bacterium]|nr:alpha/beta hydrolase [Planctomycetales bacterium]NIP71003.1 alpha/beta hydrolase [Planctomycetales bacterium]
LADVIRWGYASTRQTISQHADKFGEVLSHFPEDAEIYLVGHSMGNVVVRRYLKNKQDPRIKRMVMLAPPNQGSALGRAVNDNLLFEALWGVSGQELSNGFDELEAELGTPKFEFGIIAGQLEGNLVRNPILEGPSDLVVTVEETKLSGAADFRTVNSTHTSIMNQRETLEYVQRFLESGYFESATTRQPIK